MIFRYPVAAEGYPFGLKRARRCVTVREIDFEMRTFDRDEAPVAAILRDESNAFGGSFLTEMPVRTHEGRFFVRSPYQVSEIERRMADPFMAFDYRREIISALFVSVSGSGQAVWPHNIFPGTRSDGLTSDPRALRECLAGGEHVTFTAAGRLDIEAGDRAASGMADRFVIIDGETWQETPEPRYEVNIAPAFGISLCFDEIEKLDPYGRSFTVYYPLTDRASAHAAYHYGGQLPYRSCDAEVLLPAAFSQDCAGVNFVRFVRAAIGSAPHVDHFVLRHLLAQLRDMTGQPFEMIDLDALDHAVAETLALVDVVNAGRVRPLLDKEFVAFHWGQWTSRRVSLTQPDFDVAPTSAL